MIMFLATRISEFNAIVDHLDSLATVQITDTTANTSLKTDARLLMVNLTCGLRQFGS